MMTTTQILTLADTQADSRRICATEPLLQTLLELAALGTAHKWTSEEAQRAGKIGGTISRRGPKIRESEEGEG